MEQAEPNERLRRSSSPSPSPSPDDTLEDREGQCNGGDDTASVENSIHQMFYVISDYTAVEDSQLDLREGDQVCLLEKVNEKWWWVELEGKAGYAPTNYLTPIDEQEDKWQDEEYFSSYSSLKLHLEMLSDKPRTEAYRAAIESARDFIKDKVVLDFGAGTGILSLFCARLGGAKKVYAVEASDIAKQAKALVEHNHLSDVVTVIQTKGEELQLSEKVDLIISEWMGTLLLFELMIESVLRVRDLHLKVGGVMWPSHAQLFLVPCSAEQCYQDKVQFWDSVYGFDFSPLIPVAQSELLGRPIFNHVLSLDDCLATPTSVMTLDVRSLDVADLEESRSNFSFKITKAGTLHAFGSWFDVTFGGIPEDCDYTPSTLSTSPSSPLTHWKQDLLVIDTPLTVAMRDRVEGSLTITRNKLWRRHLRVDLEYTHISSEATGSKTYKKNFKLWR